MSTTINQSAFGVPGMARHYLVVPDFERVLDALDIRLAAMVALDHWPETNIARQAQSCLATLRQAASDSRVLAYHWIALDADSLMLYRRLFGAVDPEYHDLIRACYGAIGYLLGSYMPDSSYRDNHGDIHDGSSILELPPVLAALL